jgi:hypothetical protein
VSKTGGDSPRGPEGKVIARCEEFTLYANGWLKSSPEVERALWRATLNISGRKGSEERLELALALLELTEYAAGHRDVEPEALLERLAATLGKLLIPALSLRPMLKKSPTGRRSTIPREEGWMRPRSRRIRRGFRQGTLLCPSRAQC